MCIVAFTICLYKNSLMWVNDVISHGKWDEYIHVRLNFKMEKKEMKGVEGNSHGRLNIIFNYC